MKGSRNLLHRVILLLLLLLPLSASLQTGNNGAVHVFTLDGAIGPAVSAWLEQGFASAREQSAHLIVIQMDTPGGLDTAMRDIIQRILDEQTESWGIKVTNVELKHVDLDESMIRAIARQAEAERSRRAKVIHATGELEASQSLIEAAHKLAQEPQAMQLRYLQTLSDITAEGKKTIIFPLPMDVLSSFMKK